ncbi:1-(5-phosphoribosyl)-5-[(5-phosphoribosylamino)methylideneamino]imidazole-4-carboxamide isomerase [candidate division KSB1 bacterium]
MIVIPAIDISNGKCVRLTQGKKEAKTEYSENPVEIGLVFEEQGAEILHLIDLDRAIDSSVENQTVIEKIVKSLNIPVELGGGMRTMADIEWAIGAGVARVILGTSVISNRPLVAESIEKFTAEKIVIGIDASDGYVAIKGWKEITEVKAADLARDMEKAGASRIIYTDIKRDGMLTGPNTEELKTMLDAVNLKIIASGGISSLEDIKSLLSLNEQRLEGFITGKALYEEKFTLTEALTVVGN